MSKVMKTKILGRIGFGAILLFNFSGYASAEKNLYGDFPVTLKSYSGSKNSSVSYKGQIARHLLHESLKKASTLSVWRNNQGTRPDLFFLLLEAENSTPNKLIAT